MKPYKISVLVGSLRRESFCRKLAKELIRLKPDTLDLEIVEIRDLQLYNQDLDEETPPVEWKNFREKILSSNGVLFITPEYNRSIPGGLKNAIDVGSRPYGKNVWQGKPGAVMSVTPGTLGAFGANHILRQSMVFLDVPMMQQPEAYVSNIASSLDQESRLNESVETFMKGFLGSFVKWVEKHNS
ncbi:MAG: NAD(P)H-dependent oxidoreductase [Leptospiraceae bacterium]|nr:NAD(P)H-dependent oxidoreductase [Leptospiraceae bacterium]NUM41891.1 NAD(P)H-dependent oxidoreductase [Leptospiraceae bacterium]